MLQIGSLLGKYRIVRQLGEGGMGCVFEVMHIELDRRSALKIMLAQHAQNPLLRARFVREAKATNRVHHPGVVQIYEISELEDGTPYFIMEYLDGETLAKRLDEANATPEGRLGMAGLHALRQVASIIAKVHEKGLIHRDLKPNNLMLVTDPEVPGGERAKLLDFGIAKQTETAAAPKGDPAGRVITEPKTQVGSLLGTPQYMAPEQWGNGKPVTDKVDVYALGVMTYRVLSGRLPFLGEAPLELATQHVFNAPSPLRELCPDLPAHLTSFIDRMLAKTAEERPSMAEVASTFARLLGLPPDAPGSQIVIPDSFSSAQQVPLPGRPTTPTESASPPLGGSGAFVPSARPARPDATTGGGIPKPAPAQKTLAVEPEDLLPLDERDRPGVNAAAEGHAARPAAAATAPPSRPRWLLWGLLALAVTLGIAWLLGRQHPGTSTSPHALTQMDAGTPADGGGVPGETPPASLAEDGSAPDSALPPRDGGSPATEPGDLGPPDPGAPPPEPQTGGPVIPPNPPPLKRPPPITVHAGCLRTTGLQEAQIQGIIAGFRGSIAALPPSERAVLGNNKDGKIAVLSGLTSLPAKQKLLLEYALRGLFLKTPFPDRVEIQCPPR